MRTTVNNDPVIYYMYDSVTDRHWFTDEPVGGHGNTIWYDASSNSYNEAFDQALVYYKDVANKVAKAVPVIEGGRRCGNTTRQVDAAIQALFKGAVIYCQDHSYEETGSSIANELFMDRIIKRIELEHPQEFPHLVYSKKTNRMHFAREAFGNYHKVK